jgi:hypothetical protein
MSDPSLPLQASVVAALKGDSGVAALVGDRVYDQAPAAASFPYISLGDTQVLPDKADCIDGTEIFTVLDAWSRKEGFPEVKRIGAAIVSALDDQALSVTGYALVVFELESIRYLHDPDGLTRHAVLTFRSLLQAS